MSDYNKTILEIFEISKNVSKYCVGMEGNISGKFNDGFLIKASGTKLANLGGSDLVQFDFDGNQISNFSKRGSMESGFHNFLLSFPNINYVSHTHPTNTLKILITKFSETFAKERIFPDQVIFNNKKSCLIPYAKPGNDLTEIIKLNVNLFIKEEGYFPKLILLKNHGIITCGKTPEECITITDICEKSAEIFIGGLMLGEITFLDNISIDNLLEDKNEKYRLEQLK